MNGISMQLECVRGCEDFGVAWTTFDVTIFVGEIARSSLVVA